MRMQSIKRVLAGMVMAATLAAAPAAIAAVDMFLKLDGIDGESADKAHKGEIDVLAWSWGASANASARGNSAGCVNVQDISFTKFVDKASPKLMEKIATGRVIPKAKLTVRKAGDSASEYIVLEMSNLFVTSISMGGSGGEDRLTENVSMNFASMKFTYTPQDEQGKPGNPVASNIAGTCR